ncbi:MAG: DUF1700 domain-containing protein [Oscillospiraceae bacterium]|nr:DUF1700 domain-containing protein [Oscillospiraceae bacterium]
MTKTEYLDRLAAILKKNQIPDAEDILAEYEQHFAFKLADGYSEEEAAARLGAPELLAVQFEKRETHTGNAALTRLGLVFADFSFGLALVLLAAFGIVLIALSLACAAAAICLITGLNIAGLIPSMPYGCAVVMGLALLGLAVLTAVGCVYYFAFIRQLIRSFGRFRHNALASVSGKAALPPLPVRALLSVRANRRLRAVALIALAVFAICFVLGYIAAALSAGQLSFWHAWGWFQA